MYAIYQTVSTSNQHRRSKSRAAECTRSSNPSEVEREKGKNRKREQLNSMQFNKPTKKKPTIIFADKTNGARYLDRGHKRYAHVCVHTHTHTYARARAYSASTRKHNWWQFDFIWICTKRWRLERQLKRNRKPFLACTARTPVCCLHSFYL